MKKLILLILAICFGLVSSYASKIENVEPKPMKAIVSQVYNMFGKSAIPNEIRGSKAEVRVAVDSGNYLRIISIETDNEALKKFIKTNIDFQKLTKGTYERGIVYRIPLEVRK